MNHKKNEPLDGSSQLKITVYADFNCPYCYALNERIKNINIAYDIAWHPIEHAPSLYKHNFSHIDKQELIQEVSDVITRAPEIILNQPDFRPNSRHASQLLATIIQNHPDKAIEYRNKTYKALWQDGHDISNGKILSAILDSIGLADLPVITAADDMLKAWYTEWELGQFARNIPSLESSNGFKLLGFPPADQLEHFIQLGWSKVSDFQDASCVSSERYAIAIISTSSDNWINPVLLEAISNYQFYTSEEQLLSSVSTQDKLDMIVLNQPEKNTIETIKNIKNSNSTLNIPIFLISNNEKIQLKAFRSGVAEIAHENTPNEILGHRMVKILHAKRSAEKLFEIARIDFLTGLYNRREFNNTIKKAWCQCQRDGTPVSLLLIDLDNFKLYNDTYGHSMGDEVLRRFAQILKSCTKRPTDLAVRYGGEEFAIILPNVNLTGALHVAELIRNQTELHDIKHEASPVSPHITISVGVSEIFPTAETQSSALINQADKALYKAKENGKNQVFSFKSD